MTRLQVFIPAYERPQWTAVAVASILNQSHADLEVVVSDDSPSNRVEEALQCFRDDVRFEYRRHVARLGMAGNWNDCLSSATAEYVSIFHDDDIYDPEMVSKAIALLDAHPDMSFVHTSGRYIDEDGRDLGPVSHNWPTVTPGATFRSTLLRSTTSLVLCPTVVARRSAFLKVGLFQERPGPGNDKEMWVRLASVGTVGFIAEPLILNRVRTGARAKAGLNWSADTTCMVLELARLLPLSYGDSLVGRARGELHFFFLRNAQALKTIVHLLRHENTSEARRAHSLLANFMSPPVALASSLLLAPRTNGAAIKAIATVAEVRSLARRAKPQKAERSNT